MRHEKFCSHNPLFSIRVDKYTYSILWLFYVFILISLSKQQRKHMLQKYKLSMNCKLFCWKKFGKNLTQVYHRQLLAESRSEIPQRLNSSKLVFKWHFFKTKIHRTLTAEVGESQPRRKVCNVLRLEPSNESIWITLLHTDGIPTPDYRQWLLPSFL